MKIIFIFILSLLTYATSAAGVEERSKYFSLPVNQTARMIAGIDEPTDTMFRHIRATPAWSEYVDESALIWKQYAAKSAPLFLFTKNEVRPLSSEVKTLFYPFSGPDFLYSNLFFPNVETVYMLGLEKLGTVPQFAKVANIDGYINAYKTSINEVLTDSYYRTIQMMRYLNNQSVDGVVPVIMLFMARTNKQISQISYLTLDQNGKPVEIDYKELKSHKNNGVQIKYFDGDDETTCRKIIYFRGDAQESALANNAPYKKFFDSMVADAAFTKSASYLLHHAIFTTVRNAILRTCDLVLSDDTGIAYRYYSPKVWDIQLYGSYNGCIDDFKYILEKDLKAAYGDSTRLIKPLPFRIGYSRPSNFRIVERKK